MRTRLSLFLFLPVALLAQTPPQALPPQKSVNEAVDSMQNTLKELETDIERSEARLAKYKAEEALRREIALHVEKIRAAWPVLLGGAPSAGVEAECRAIELLLPGLESAKDRTDELAFLQEVRALLPELTHYAPALALKEAWARHLTSRDQAAELANAGQRLQTMDHSGLRQCTLVRVANALAAVRANTNPFAGCATAFPLEADLAQRLARSLASKPLEALPDYLSQAPAHYIRASSEVPKAFDEALSKKAWILWRQAFEGERDIATLMQAIRGEASAKAAWPRIAELRVAMPKARDALSNIATGMDDWELYGYMSKAWKRMDERNQAVDKAEQARIAGLLDAALISIVFMEYGAAPEEDLPVEVRSDLNQLRQGNQEMTAAFAAVCDEPTARSFGQRMRQSSAQTKVIQNGLAIRLNTQPEPIQRRVMVEFAKIQAGSKKTLQTETARINALPEGQALLGLIQAEAAGR
jgi:hypothetical protein